MLQATPAVLPEEPVIVEDAKLHSRLSMDDFKPIAVLGRGHFGKVSVCGCYIDRSSDVAILQAAYRQRGHYLYTAELLLLCPVFWKLE